MLAPPAPPPEDQLELLIREARARQRRRRMLAAAAVAAVAGAALAAYSVAVGTRPTATRPGASRTAAGSVRKCGVRVAWTKILAPDGRVLYREPASRTKGHQLQCSGASIWVVFDNGAGMSQEAYFGVHSGDGGRTWRPVFAERYFGLTAPHQLDDYLGPWTLTRSAAFFTGACPSCDPQPTVSLWVTSDGGRTFRRYDLRGLDGYWPTAIRVRRGLATVVGGLGQKTVTVRVS